MKLDRIKKLVDALSALDSTITHYEHQERNVNGHYSDSGVTSIRRCLLHAKAQLKSVKLELVELLT